MLASPGKPEVISKAADSDKFHHPRLLSTLNVCMLLSRRDDFAACMKVSFYMLLL